MKTNERQLMVTPVLENEVTLMGKTFNVYGTVEEPLFKAKDVADWIEHSNVSAMVQSVDDDERVISRTKDSLDRESTVRKVTETAFANGLSPQVIMDNLNVSGVYKILCLVNGKFYIGSSKNIRTRWYEHWSERERAKTKNQMMYDDMRKYGKENFRIYVIYEGDDYKHIEKVVTYNLQPEYNIRNKTRKESHKKVKRFKDRNEYMRHYYSTHKGYRDYLKMYNKERTNRLCSYNGETLPMWALYLRFRREGLRNAAQEARKYLI